MSKTVTRQNCVCFIGYYYYFNFSDILYFQKKKDFSLVLCFRYVVNCLLTLHAASACQFAAGTHEFPQ